MMARQHNVLDAARCALLLAMCVAGLVFSTDSAVAEYKSPHKSFVDAQSLIPDLVVEMRYVTAQNFVGRPIPGYNGARCLLTHRAAKALQCAADVLRPRGYAIKVYDCYRPQRAVNAFVNWGRNLRDQKMKQAYYPEVDKRNLFRDSFISSRSGHSRGSTVDLSIVPLATHDVPFEAGDSVVRACDSNSGKRTDDGSVDMGTGFDCFSTLSHTRSQKVSDVQRQNRTILRDAMSACGFRNLYSEWWHYTLRNEPYPNTYFDFPVE
ncbi:M15 family metallopeptidase [Hyphomicrobium sulfonivorans]|uniref:M15 family metallopeptidase n=2 Tax=Hyphomicrobium sulfonivorans TaxID=121290 RepID=UPI0015705A91|nr:M15 family metallopeptidase [Hyphomicrobium sulfonivorans]MBI1649601.1 M15 family metallopeptidase [Hyphomicrobium sulfonivorans]NSL71516.1 D-alanyl-D-alanine dipeptidase [Hyphomicrobium sulfonivorans]